jgi:lysophospholipase L1-like esterase
LGHSSSGKTFVYGSTSPSNGPKSFRILCYGDSNTCGWRGVDKTLYPYGQELAEALKAAGFSCEVTCCGLCGYTSGELVNNINSAHLKPSLGPSGAGLSHLLRDAGPFDLVILMVGTNDIGKSMDTRISQAFVKGLHKTCHRLGVPTVNLAPPHIAEVDEFGSHTELRTKMRDLRKRLTDVVDTWANGRPQVLLSLDCEILVPKFPHLWEKDEFHLSINGSKQLGKQLASQLTSVLGQLTQRGELAHKPVASSLAPQKPLASPLTSQRQMQPVVWAGHTPVVVGSTPVVGVMPINNFLQPIAVATPMGMYRNCRPTTLVGASAARMVPVW